MNYLVKRNGIYYFRTWIPEDLKLYIRRREICKSLRTKSYQLATSYAKALIYNLETVFMQIRSGMLTDDQIQKVIKDHLTRTLKGFEAVRNMGVLTYAPKGGKLPANESERQQSSIAVLQQSIEHYSRQLFNNDFSEVEKYVDRLIDRHSYDFLHGYPTFAIDYLALGRNDLALDIINESIQFVGDLRPKYRMATLVVVADVCHQIGELGRCTELLGIITLYVRGRKVFRSVDNVFAGELVALYLKLGMVSDAQSLADKVADIEHAKAVAWMASCNRRTAQCIDFTIDAVADAETWKGAGYATALITDLAAQGSQFRRGDRLLKLTRTVGQVALFSTSEADALVNMILDAPLGKLDRRNGKSNLSTNLYYTSILFELAMLIDEHRLDWTDLVREKFRAHLHSIPVLQRHKIFGYLMEAPAVV
jgi:hypothetical protein